MNKANKGYFICKSEMVKQNGRDGLRWSDVKFFYFFFLFQTIMSISN